MIAQKKAAGEAALYKTGKSEATGFGQYFWSHGLRGELTLQLLIERAHTGAGRSLTKLWGLTNSIANLVKQTISRHRIQLLFLSLRL
ncbi:hypothetical protein [Pseudomonas syringae]|uniref:hypothetical protein n=1 Tax=Pseudomonas syringae TaxID=317 RepID=UPI000EFB1E7B|nr:hypothetical protein [Pseudomonas syringae]